MKYEDVLIKLRKIIRSVDLESKRVQKQYGISIPQLLVLQYLSDQDDCKASIKEIKEYLSLNGSTVTGIIQRLDKKDLIVKKTSDKDKRKTNVFLTASGMKLIKASPTTLQEKVSERLQALPPHELTAIDNAIELLTKLMDIQDLDAAPIITTFDKPNN